MNIQLKAKRQDGFTIIELVVVILLLGILAATALPRFLDVTQEAHDSVVEGVVGGLNSGSALFRATWVATGQPTDTAVGDYGNGLLFANEDGYPIGLNATLAHGDCKEIYDGLLQSGRPESASATIANGADEQTTEDAIEAAAGATVDIVAVLDEAAVMADTTSCSFYYVGQFKAGDATTSQTVPKITYDFTTGEITTATFTMELDAGA